MLGSREGRILSAGRAEPTSIEQSARTFFCPQADNGRE
jgi:hypothetical protein